MVQLSDRPIWLRSYRKDRSLLPFEDTRVSFAEKPARRLSMTNAINPVAPHDLPAFITAPGETDVLFNVMIGVVIVVVLLTGVLYFRLHALPEQIAHRTTKVQYEIVAVLGLLSLFTHNHIYWIAGLLLALIPLPDFSTPLNRMAESLAKMAGARQQLPAIGEPPPQDTSKTMNSKLTEQTGKAKDLTHA
jgi:hypothetical protein